MADHHFDLFGDGADEKGSGFLESTNAAGEPWFQVRPSALDRPAPSRPLSRRDQPPPPASRRPPTPPGQAWAEAALAASAVPDPHDDLIGPLPAAPAPLPAADVALMAAALGAEISARRAEILAEDLRLDPADRARLEALSGRGEVSLRGRPAGYADRRLHDDDPEAVRAPRRASSRLFVAVLLLAAVIVAAVLVIHPGG